MLLLYIYWYSQPFDNTRIFTSGKKKFFMEENPNRLQAVGSEFFHSPYNTLNISNNLWAACYSSIKIVLKRSFFFFFSSWLLYLKNTKRNINKTSFFFFFYRISHGSFLPYYVYFYFFFFWNYKSQTEFLNLYIYNFFFSFLSFSFLLFEIIIHLFLCLFVHDRCCNCLLLSALPSLSLASFMSQQKLVANTDLLGSFNITNYTTINFV